MIIRVLVVDDSAFMRIALRKMLADYPDIEVVGEAKNGAVAVEMARELKPDVITMDVEMPEMNGLEATKAIMATAPCSIIMISSLTAHGATTTIQALEMGAVDFIPKQSSFVQLDIVQIGEELARKVRFWAAQQRQKVLRTLAGRVSPPLVIQKRAPRGNVGLVVVGVSTGGPAAMPKVLASMGRLDCPMVIAQHMPAVFTKSFADHMRLETGLNVVEGRDGLQLESGMVVVARGGVDSIVREPFPGSLLLYEKRVEAALIHPNADVLFRSVELLSVGVVAVLMTGMGSDGTEGAKRLFARGVPILAQDPACCVVDGMPGSAIAANVVSEILALEALGRRLAKWCNPASELAGHCR